LSEKIVGCILISLFVLLTVQPILAAQSSSQIITSTGTISHSEIATGLDCLSTYHLYSPKYATDAILNRDFSRFRSDGISVISLSLYWYRLEGNQRGSYNGTLPDGTVYGDAFLDNVKHVIATANQYGIKVLVTFHTLWADDSPWCTPDYVIDPVSGKNIGLAIVRDPEMRQGFIDMVNHTVTYLAGTPGIWAWALFNEPWYWGRTATEHDFITSNGQTQKENFINLIQKLSINVKENNAGLVTVKFISSSEGKNSTGGEYLKNIFIEDWSLDAQIFDSLDFISFDEYLTYPQQKSKWEVITTSNINDCVARGKQVWITEFGISNDNSAQQASDMTTMVKFFETLPIKGWLAWFWEGDSAPEGWSQVPGQFGKGYNLCASADGTPRPAYYCILR
jgi:hypothetical protein